MYGEPPSPETSLDPSVRDERAVAAVDDLTLLLVAVLAFSLFFASLAGAYVQRQAADRGHRLQEKADALLAAVLDDPRWTSGHGRLRADALGAASGSDLAGVAAGHAFRVVVRDLATNGTWTLANGPPAGDRRIAATSANVIGETVDPARVTATVWGP